jgi:hypothetical protein
MFQDTRCEIEIEITVLLQDSGGLEAPTVSSQKDESGVSQSLKQPPILTNVGAKRTHGELLVVNVDKRGTCRIAGIQELGEAIGEVPGHEGTVSTDRPGREYLRLDPTLLGKIEKLLLLGQKIAILVMLKNEIQAHEAKSYG